MHNIKGIIFDSKIMRNLGKSLKINIMCVIIIIDNSIVLVWYVSISVIERMALKRQVSVLQKLCNEQYFMKG